MRGEFFSMYGVMMGFLLDDATLDTMVDLSCGILM